MDELTSVFFYAYRKTDDVRADVAELHRREALAAAEKAKEKKEEEHVSNRD